MKNKDKTKIALYVGDLPTTTFINRLAVGLSKNDGLRLILYGQIHRKFIKEARLKYSGAKDGMFNGKINRLIRFLRYFVLLSLFRRSDRKKLDDWLSSHGVNSWFHKSLHYPILFDDPQVLHVQWAKALEQFMWVQLFGTKLVLSLRGAHINYSPISDSSLAIKYEKCFPQVDMFHAVSKAIGREAEKYGAELDKIKVVYSGLNIDDFLMSKSISKYESLGSRPLKIVSVGRAHWKKGYHYALDSCEIMKNSGFDFEYTVIGGTSEELVFQHNQLRLVNYVKLLGNIPFEKVKDEIKRADVLLLPSVEEGVANVVLEAMALGTLVVSTDCGGMSEVIEHEKNGLIVPTRDPVSIASALSSIQQLGTEHIQEMIQAARLRIESVHTEKEMVQGMTSLYNKVLIN